MAAMRIRRARLADIDALLALETRFPTDRLSRASFRHLLTRGHADLWVAQIGDAVVGDALVCYRRGSRRARLYSIVTDGAHTGRGIGRALLAACEAGARACGCEELRLEVRPDNRAALGLYRGRGYQVTGTLAHFYEDASPAVRLCKSLDPPGARRGRATRPGAAAGSYL
jgi:ribosomal protein S18 acetylase RimI-like enzyme